MLGSKDPTSTVSDSDIVMGRTPLPEAKVNASTSPRHWRAGEGAGEAQGREAELLSFSWIRLRSLLRLSNYPSVGWTEGVGDLPHGWCFPPHSFYLLSLFKCRDDSGSHDL